MRLNKIKDEEYRKKVETFVESLSVSGESKKKIAEWVNKAYAKAKKESSDEALLGKALLHTLCHIDLSTLLEEDEGYAREYFEGYLINEIKYMKMRAEGRPVFYFTG